MSKKENPPILIFGATGFVGSHILDKLVKKRRRVIVIARTPSKVKKKSKFLTVIKGDLLKPGTYEKQLKQVETIYYLVHAMDQHGDFKKIERKQARELTKLLKKKHTVIYLSGLGKPGSDHIKSRHDVGKVFHKSLAKSIELRASIVIGAGSLSFEMIHGIARRFPFTVKTDWSEALCEPVALDDLIYTLLRIEEKSFKSGVYEIGSGEAIPYSELIVSSAKAKGKWLPKIYLPKVPKSLVLEVMRFMLPEYYQVGQHLMGSIEIPTYVENQNILNELGRKPTSVKQAITKAIKVSEGSISDDFDWRDRLEEILKTLPESLQLNLKKAYRLLKLFNFT